MSVVFRPTLTNPKNHVRSTFGNAKTMHNILLELQNYIKTTISPGWSPSEPHRWIIAEMGNKPGILLKFKEQRWDAVEKGLKFSHHPIFDFFNRRHIVPTTTP